MSQRLYTINLTPNAGELAVARALQEMRRPSREQIEAFEADLLKLPQLDIPVTHRFAESQDLYAREILIPKDALMTGRVHKFEHVSIMVYGDMTVMTDKGMERIKGYHCWICPPGTKRVGYAHAETLWITVHRTTHRTPEGIEDVLCEPMQRLEGAQACQLLQQQ